MTMALSTPSLPKTLTNVPFDEIKIGAKASLSRRLSEEDVILFALATGDVNPAHIDPEFSARDLFHRIIAHGMWSGGLISAVLGTKLPGPGTIYLGQELSFLAPVAPGDTITAEVTVTAKSPPDHVTLDCRCTNQEGTLVVTGTARVKAPREKLSFTLGELPQIRVLRHERLEAIIRRAAEGPALSTAIVHPTDTLALHAAFEAARAGLIVPVLVGPRPLIEAAAREAGVSLEGVEIIDAPTPPEAAARAVQLVREAKAELLMKGALHTDELMHAVVDPVAGLNIGRRISHVYMMDVPGYDRPLLITDAAINIAPSLEEKRDIIQNAIELAQAMGVARPRVAVLSAIETINPKIRSTLDAAALCKMADRGQITGGIVDGPLAFDNAVSAEAAREKHIVSEVAGRADILVVPDLEAGNMLAKQLTFLAGADAAGVVLGARVPIILTSRADSERTRIASAAVAVLLARRRHAAR
jgi:phosphotransacetylase/acyl dehydratase